jgi:hypothetical protein
MKSTCFDNLPNDNPPWNMKPLALSFILLSFLICCSEDEPEQIEETFPADADVIGYWKLSKVFLNDKEVSFDNHELNLVNEYYRISADESVHHVMQEAATARAYNDIWALDKTILQIGAVHGQFYKIQSFGNAQLVLSPNARQNLKLEYKAINEQDFPELSFSAVVAGKAWTNTSTGADIFDTSMQLNASTDEFFLVIAIPTSASAGHQFTKSESAHEFGALIYKNTADYGNLQEGIVTVIKRARDYIHVEFEFIVKKNEGTETIVVTGGSLRTILPG